MKKIFFKDLKTFISDPKAVLLTFLLPILLISFFVFAYGGAGQKTSKPAPLSIGICDLDHSSLSKEIINQMNNIPEIHPVNVNFDEGKQKVKKGKLPAVFVINKGLYDSINAGSGVALDFYYDKSKEIEVGLIQKAISAKLYALLSGKIIEPKILSSIDEKYAALPENVLNEIKSEVKSNFSQNNEDISSGIKFNFIEVEKNKRNNWGLIHSVAGIAVMMLLFSVTAMGGSMLSEKESGTLKRLIASPLSPFDILFGKYIYSTVIATVQLMVLFLFAWAVFGLDIFAHLPKVLIMIVATALCCASFGMFLAAICKTRKQVDGLSVLIILLMSALGGSMIPLVFMPAFFQKLAVISVNYWSIQGFYDIFWRGLGWIDLLPKVGVLILIAACLMIISTYFFKKNVLKIN